MFSYFLSTSTTGTESDQQRLGMKPWSHRSLLSQYSTALSRVKPMIRSGISEHTQQQQQQQYLFGKKKPGCQKGHRPIKAGHPKVK